MAAFAYYIADTLYYHDRGQMLVERLQDLCEGETIKDDRTPEEKIADIMKKAGLKLKE